jgi:hypothetical protein
MHLRKQLASLGKAPPSSSLQLTRKTIFSLVNSALLSPLCPTTAVFLWQLS